MPAEVAMPYQLKAHETFSEGIKRIVAEELASALKSLRGDAQDDTEDDAHDTIHDARKRFKKLRAALRLVRSDLGEKRYRQLNALLRNAGRQLSELRDAEVLVTTLDALAEHSKDAHDAHATATDGKLRQKAFREARKTLLARQQRGVVHAGGLTAEVAKTVAPLQNRIARRRLGNGWDAVSPNLRRGYARGRKAFAEAYRHPSDDSFHEWRKGVKELWYHLRILNPLWPEVMGELKAQAGKLADVLGAEHDLAVLSQTLSAAPGEFGDAAEVDALLARIEVRRNTLRNEARLLGGRLYADKPKGFSKRFKVYWQVWREEAQRKAAP
jgi:CHAD domain-containing protein